MSPQLPISRVINLISKESQRLWAIDESDARRHLLASDLEGVLHLDGSFALLAQDGERVVLARSLDRPMRYFLAKSADGPVLIVGERIDEIVAELIRRGWADQFHPSYTRMVPAHHVTTLRLIGCPDPNPMHRRFFDPPRGTLPNDLDLIGRHYIEAVYGELRRWLAVQNPVSPIGVPFSGGIDSGAILLCLYTLLLNEGHSPARLKAFTLSVDGEGEDARQAHDFLRRTNLAMLGEIIDVGALPDGAGGCSAACCTSADSAGVAGTVAVDGAGMPDCAPGSGVADGATTIDPAATPLPWPPPVDFGGFFGSNAVSPGKSGATLWICGAESALWVALGRALSPEQATAKRAKDTAE